MESTIRDIPPAGLKIIETLRWTPESGFLRRERHMARCARTCRTLGVRLDRAAIEAAFATIAGQGMMRVRMTIDLSGEIEISASPMVPVAPGTVWSLCVASEKLDSGDPFLRLKTTHRRVYDDGRAALSPDCDEAIFLNERGEICDGTITNFFACFAAGMVTPPCRSGLLPGVLRADLLARGACREAVLTLADLNRAEALWVGNSLRGLVPARMVGTAPSP